jgi:hypothetical protein
MEDYFNPSRPLHDLQKDERSVQGYYVGFKEQPEAMSRGQAGCTTKLKQLTLDINTRSPDLGPNYHWQFFWYMNKNLKASYGTEFSALNLVNVVPSPDFLRERWAEIMDKWGQSMKNAYVL